MRVAVLATGGKDSTLALYPRSQRGHEVACLATMIPLREDSWMFHYPEHSTNRSFRGSSEHSRGES